MIDLREELIKLQHQLRDETVKQYNRVNPFVEDITDWKEKGEFLFGKGKTQQVKESRNPHWGSTVRPRDTGK